MYLVDTNVVSEARPGSPQATGWLRSVDPRDQPLGGLGMSSSPATGSKPLAAAPSDASVPSPLPPSETSLPAHLERLTDRARDYVDAASSANTRRACP